jgi:hypothetical protein
MRKLESVIAEFVGDLLRTIGEATVEDLRELFEGRPESEMLSELPVNLASLGTSATSSPPARLGLPPRGVRGEERASALRRSAVLLSTTVPGPFLPPGVAEITDPESLLSLGAPKARGESTGDALAGGLLADPTRGDSASFEAPIRTPRRVRSQALLEVREPATPLDGHAGRPTDPDVESPASGVRPVGGATVKLSDNETLARVSNSGVVIRRRKRA